MDIFAHALWTASAAVAARRKTYRPLRLGWAAFWGVFPDLATFAVPAALRIWWWLTGASKTLLPQAHSPHFPWAWGLYNRAHSAVVFAAFFGVAWLLLRRPELEMLGWELHISSDIFTHRGLFATHFLWPLSSFSINGIPWETGWLLAVNYTALTAVYLLLWARCVARSNTGTCNSA